MPKLLTATAYVSLSCCTIALAQTNVSPGQQTAESAHHIPKAPVAHPRPTPRDISAAKEVDDNGMLGADADDKALDRKIKSICRGCF